MPCMHLLQFKKNQHSVPYLGVPTNTSQLPHSEIHRQPRASKEHKLSAKESTNSLSVQSINLSGLRAGKQQSRLSRNVKPRRHSSPHFALTLMEPAPQKKNKNKVLQL